MTQPRPFEFDPNGKQYRMTDEQLLNNLRRFAAKKRGRPFLVEEFNDWRGRKVHYNTIAVRFGSWRNALSLVGVEGGRTRSADPADLLAKYEGLWRKVGYPPGGSVLRRHGAPSPCTYNRHWGSLHNLRMLIARHHRGEIAREDILAQARPQLYGRPREEVKSTARSRRNLPPALRWSVIQRDLYRCAICGRSPATGDPIKLHVDHILPVSKGGTNDSENLRTLCSECNLGRGNETHTHGLPQQNPERKRGEPGDTDSPPGNPLPAPEGPASKKDSSPPRLPHMASSPKSV